MLLSPRVHAYILQENTEKSAAKSPSMEWAGQNNVIMQTTIPQFEIYPQRGRMAVEFC